MERLLPLAVELLEEVLLVEDRLKALDSCANLLVEDPDNFFG